VAYYIFKEEKNYDACTKFKLEKYNKTFCERMCTDNQHAHMLQEQNKNELKILKLQTLNILNLRQILSTYCKNTQR